MTELAHFNSSTCIAKIYSSYNNHICLFEGMVKDFDEYKKIDDAIRSAEKIATKTAMLVVIKKMQDELKSLEDGVYGY